MPNQAFLTILIVVLLFILTNQLCNYLETGKIFLLKIDKTIKEYWFLVLVVLIVMSIIMGSVFCKQI
jgi:hypothetical protein